jgi:hypothetical protein
MKNRQQISPIYNFVLFSYVCVDFLVSTLFDPNFDAKVPWDAVYGAYPTLSITAALVIGVILLLWGANLFKKFWNRLISDIFNVRELEFQESLAIVLILAIIGG